ncbi:MAG: hypothetical protein AAGC76_13510 [Luteibacter sp.]|uniref:hypothetical protein n=1 Tax=Rhodanobacteraceae TaxID=1775411 RepID=UPI00068D6E7E|nr:MULTISPECIES: hypothetical protein [Rhodanobacteraceae]MDQ7996850.1 hypothetical protein [Luteibacter sp.]MDQ8049221.1 hypothetical protein [Luteibacter sp.]MDR6643500.1 hypothetical protein [Luteibacter sp. 1214]SDF32526.1 hypothetical protein SAMN04515659_0681 [Dyella sp. 333MFSha]
MRWFLAIFYCFLNLAGCTDSQNRVMVVTAKENGHVNLDSRTEVRMGRARFACEASDSGQCHYTVFDGDKPLRSFVLAVREERRVDGLPGGFAQCVTRDGAKMSPTCKAI